MITTLSLKKDLDKIQRTWFFSCEDLPTCFNFYVYSVNSLFLLYVLLNQMFISLLYVSAFINSHFTSLGDLYITQQVINVFYNYEDFHLIGFLGWFSFHFCEHKKKKRTDLIFLICHFLQNVHFFPLQFAFKLVSTNLC